MTIQKNIQLGIVIFILLGLMGCIKGGTSFSDDENTIASTSLTVEETEELTDPSTITTTTTTTAIPTTTIIISQPSTSDENSLVESVFPQHTISTGGILASPIQIEFNRVMNVSSVNSAVSMSGGNSSIQLTALTTGDTAETFFFQPTTSLQLSTIYLVTISTAARDSQGNAMSAEDKWLIRTRNISHSFSPENTGSFKVGNTMCCLLGMDLSTELNTEDLIVSGDGNIIRFKNDGNGISTSNTIKSANTSALFSAITQTDVDRDSLEDIVMILDAGSNITNVYSFLNQMDVNSSTPFTSTGNTKVTSISGVSLLGSQMASGDINNDGNMDLAFIDQGGTQPRVLVLGGVGTGTFALVAELLLDSKALPSDLSLTDINQDGNSDVAVLSTSENTMILYTGDGNGVFSEITTSNLSTLLGSMSPQRFVVTDFDGDNYPDFVISDLANDQIVYLSNQKDQTFKVLSQVAVGSAPGAITYGNFNNDNFLDVAVANVDDSEVSILLGDGAGEFTKKENLAANRNIIQMITANMNGDAIDDLAVMSSDSSGFGLFLGSDEGVFSTSGNLALGDAPSAVVLMDINEDSITDLIVSNYGDSDLSILIGNGKNSFSRQPDVSLAASTLPVDMVVGDFDNDQQNEFITLNEGNNTITLFNINSGQLQSLFSVSVAGDRPQQGVAGDFNSDGQLDLALVMSNSDQLTILLNTGGGFSDLNQNIVTTSSKPVSLATGYFNSDDDLDLAVVNQNSKTISIYFGTGTGHFALVQTISAPTSIQTTTSIILGEIAVVTDEDNLVTLLAVIDQGTPKASISEQKNVFLYTNSGGTFSYSSALSVSAQPEHITISDLNGDTIPELIVTAPSLLVVFTDDGDGLYTSSSTNVTVGSNPQRAVATDLDGDLAPDIIVLDQTNDELSILFQR